MFQIKKGDILFVWGKSLVEELITDISHGASHCALFVDENTVCEAQFGRVVGEANLQDYIDDKNTVRLEVWTDDSLTDEQREDMIAYAKTMYGQHYDVKLIPLELIHFLTRNNLEWYREGNEKICSTLVYSAGLKEGRDWSMYVNPSPPELNIGIRFSQLLKGQS